MFSRVSQHHRGELQLNHSITLEKSRGLHFFRDKILVVREISLSCLSLFFEDVTKDFFEERKVLGVRAKEPGADGIVTIFIGRKGRKARHV